MFNASAFLSVATKFYDGAIKISTSISSSPNNTESSINESNQSNHHVVEQQWQEHAPTFTPTSQLRVIVLTCMAIASLFANLATMWNIQRTRAARCGNRQSWTAIYILLFHLSVADLLVTVFCIAGEAVWTYTVEWHAGTIACKSFKFAQMFSLYVSTFVLILIGIDRWIAVKYPWRSLNVDRRCCRLLALAWAMAITLSLPQLLIFDVRTGPFVEPFQQCVTYGFYTAQWQEQLYTMVTLLLMFIGPLIVLVTTYAATFKSIAASQLMFASGLEEMDQSQALRRQAIINRAKIKSLRISVVIVSAFIVCWSPYYIMLITFQFLRTDPSSADDDRLKSAIFYFGMSNSLVNPIIYGAFHVWPAWQRRKFRRTATIVGQQSSLKYVCVYQYCVL